MCVWYYVSNLGNGSWCILAREPYVQSFIGICYLKFRVHQLMLPRLNLVLRQYQLTLYKGSNLFMSRINGLWLRSFGSNQGFGVDLREHGCYTWAHELGLGGFQLEHVQSSESALPRLCISTIVFGNIPPKSTHRYNTCVGPANVSLFRVMLPTCLSTCHLLPS